ncbi:hypothetical protein [Algiphilus aromaticivorans]|uniref:hypothetical protein n=1 Tax=Algiphilus aromaticivorans TaxID=382454 RepID=UPI0012EC59EA|nr:hypothetical protein [Algiphilus aromaticivorans]
MTPNSVVTSEAVTITGMRGTLPVTVDGGRYSIGCTTEYVATAGSIDNDQTVCLRHTSASGGDIRTETTLTVGEVSAGFNSVTQLDTETLGLLSYLDGNGELLVLDPTGIPTAADARLADSGIAPLPAGEPCVACFGQARAYPAGELSGSTFSGVHFARLAYIKRAVGNDSGGQVFRLETTPGPATPVPHRISSIGDACRITPTQTDDWFDVDAAAVVIERAGPDEKCSQTEDNAATVIRLSSPTSDPGTNLSLALNTKNPLHARRDASGAITGYLSFEIDQSNPADPVSELVLRDLDFGRVARLATLAPLDITAASQIEQIGLSGLFISMTPTGESLQLFRLNADASLSPSLHTFQGFNADSPLRKHLSDANHLYFADANRLMRLPLDADGTSSARLLTTLDSALKIEGERRLDPDSSPARVVFEAVDESFTVESGVFSVAANADDAPVTVLAQYPDSDGGEAKLQAVVAGSAYINITEFGVLVPEDALRIATDGSNSDLIDSGYWAGSSRQTSFDLADIGAIPPEFIFLVTRTQGEFTADDTLQSVDPETGERLKTQGTADDAATFQSVRASGFGRYLLARGEISRFGTPDHDVYFLDAENADSFTPLAVTRDTNDIPLNLRADF